MFLPTTIKEVRERGWDQLDVILFSGDAYIDHPAFGAAVVGRLLEAEGYRVAIVPQPNWRDDLRDFRKLGAPRLFFGISGGSMDSMVNHYTANLRLRHDDAYTPGGKAGFRPDRAVTVYSQILKRLYPHVPVVIGGIEASLRRLTHYDYWSDALKPSILAESDIIQDQIWGRVTQNRSQGRATWYFADEFHLLLKEEQTAAYSAEIWKRFRKWGGVPTGSTQNVKDLLSSPEIENILENSDFITLLNQASGDRKILSERLNLSADQQKYIDNSEPGEGLLIFENVVLPFSNPIPKNTQLYKIMTTRLSEVVEL